MRLASAEVKRLLAHGQCTGASVDDIVFSSRTLICDPTLGATQATQPTSRLALAVAKRHLSRAVDRNRVKRILREAFRHHEIRDTGVDVLVTLGAVPNTIAGNARRKDATQRIRAAAIALLTKLATRSRAR